MGCRLPNARNPEEFWKMLHRGESAVAPVPESRFNRSLYFDPKKGVFGRSYCDKAALIDYGEAAAPGGCVTRQDIERQDPAHIILARVAEETLRNSGRPMSTLKGRNVGVYLGHAAGSGIGAEYTYGIHIAQVAEYLSEIDDIKALPEHREIVRRLVDRVRRKTPWRTRERNPHLAPGDAALFLLEKFGWTGPGMVFNSACASALQAIGHGMKALQLGRIDAALVGGVSCFHSDTLVLFSAAHSLSAVGSYPFTEKADGLIPGEGCVLFLLKTLEQAVGDGDEILAVLPDVGISSDGRGASLWAPRKEGQIEAMSRAYEHGVDLSGLEYIEGHFTSTHLGDKTEIESITEFLQGRLARKIPVGSVKRNIGHGLEVAGAVGLLKVVLSLKNATLPSAVEPGAELNQDVDWNSVPLYPPDRNLAWPIHLDGTPRRAGVNAFGIGGLNVHLVVEDYVGNAPRPLPTSPDDDSIAVIGIGTVLPGAFKAEELQTALNSSQRQIRPLPIRPWDAALFADRKRWGDKAIEIPGGGVVDNYQFDWKRHRIPPKQVNNGSPLQFMILDAIDQAFHQAGIKENFDHLRTGCVVGTMFGGDFATQLVMSLRLPETCDDLRTEFRGVFKDSGERALQEFTKKVNKHMPALIDETGSFTSSALASRVTKTYHLMGGGVAVEAGNGSAAAALGAAIDMLRTDACEMMVCVAGQHDLTPGAYHELALSDRMAAPLDFAPPFDSRARGTLPGEGCVVLLLKRLKDAKRDGNTVLGIIRGMGAAANSTLSEAVVDSTKRALNDAGLTAELVRGIETAGCGLSDLDAAELEALESVYGTAAGTIPVGTSVGTFGHLGAASGFVSLVAGLTALEQEMLPGTSSFGKPVKPLRGFSFSAEPQKIETGDSEGRLVIGINVCSDFGNCYHVLLQRGTPVTPNPTLSAPSRSALAIERISNSTFHFDATAARRERLRSGKSQTPTAPTPLQSPQASSPHPPSPDSQGTLPTPSAPVQSVKGPVTISVARPVSQTPAPIPVSQTPTPNRTEVEEFLINYVVEQTEYPREMVDLDEPLTDLGIDSIKKAQMFGELAECFDVQPRADLKFEDITTLRMILNVIAEETVAPAPQTSEHRSAPTSQTPALNRVEVEEFLINYVVEQTEYPREMVDLDEPLTDLGIDSIKKAQMFGELAECFDVQPRTDLKFEDITTLRMILDVILSTA